MSCVEEVPEEIAGPAAAGALAGVAGHPGEDAARRWLGIGAVALAGMSFGVQGVLGKYAYAGGVNVPTLLAIRFAVATLVLWGVYAVLLRREKGPPLRQPAGRVLGFGALGALFVGNSLFYFLALARLPVSTTSLLLFVFPAMVVVWAALFFGERLSWPKTGALVLALTGCLLTVGPGAVLAAGPGVSRLGVLLALGSAFSYSWYTVLAGRIGRDVSGLTMTLYSVPVTALCFGGYALATGSFGAAATPTGWLSCLGIGVLTGLSAYLVLAGIGLIGASRAAIASTIEPVTTVILGAVLLAEPLTPMKLLGGLCIIVGVVALSRTREEAVVGSSGAEER